MYIVLKVQDDILKINKFIAHFVFSWFDNLLTFVKITHVVVFKQLHNLILIKGL